MFCPNCGVENLSHQAYCSRCGQLLTHLQLALEGRLDDIAVRLKASEKMLTIGNAMLGLFVLSGLLIIFIGLISWLMTGVFAPPTGYILAILGTLSLGAVLGVPFTLLSKTRLSGALREMEESSNANRLMIDKAHKLREQIGVSGAPNSKAQIPSSVTEDTTVRLRMPQQERKQ